MIPSFAEAVVEQSSQGSASRAPKCHLFLQCCKTKYLEKQVKQIVTKSATFADLLVALERQYPSYETDLSIRAEIQNLAALPNNPKPATFSDLLANLDHWVGRLQGGGGGVAHPSTSGPPVPSNLHGRYLYIFIYEYMYKYPAPPPPQAWAV